MIFDGKLVAKAIKDEVKAEISKFEITPCLAVIVVGDDPASAVYVRNKEKACEYCGITSRVYKYPKNISEIELIRAIQYLNANPQVNGILIQLPLPSHINENVIVNTVLPSKDVDGFTTTNIGKLFSGHPALTPCTPTGIMDLLKFYEYPLKGKHAVIIGRSNIVGRPMAAMLEQADCTVSLCHSQTNRYDRETLLDDADLVVVATGRPNTLTEYDLCNNFHATIIDVGINRVDDKLCGDVDESIKAKYAANYTTVPGGVGPLTVAALMKNTLKAYKMQNS